KRLNPNNKSFLQLSQIMTLTLGTIALLIALTAAEESVLDLMLLSYAFMVSGLLVPLVGGLVFNVKDKVAAVTSMFVGGATTLSFQINEITIYDLDPNIFGITASFLTFIIIVYLRKKI
ncbi:MAG: hypothetical protein ABEH43_09260, partial [Flavobacteriales bacterium]